MKNAVVMVVVVSCFVVSSSQAILINMSDGSSVHHDMGPSTHYPALWAGMYNHGTDQLVTYLKFDLTPIEDNANILSITLRGTAEAYTGDSVLKAYHVDDDTLGGSTYSGIVYNSFHSYNSYLGVENAQGFETYAWDISAYNYQQDLNDNTLTLAITSDTRAEGGHWVRFNRDFQLDVNYQTVPEPSTIAFVGIFGGGLWFVRRYFPRV